MFTILHNPKCSKSRKTLELLQENNINPEIREYLKDPLEFSEILELSTLLQKPVINFTRTGESFWKENNMDPNTLSETDLIEKLVQFPIGLERPIVIRELHGIKKIIIGRPPENVMELVTKDL